MGKCIFILTEPKLLCEVAAEVKDEEEDGGHLSDRLTFFPALKDTPVITEDLPDPLAPVPCSLTQDCPDIRVILQELLPGEEVLWVGVCVGMLGCKHGPKKKHNCFPPY